MKNFLTALVAFLLWAALALLFHHYISDSICGECCSKDKTTEKNQKTAPTTDNSVTKMAFAITAPDGTKLFDFANGFIINNKNGDVTISEELVGIKDSIYNYLNAHQGKELLVSAKYLTSEVDSTKKMHFGSDRASFLKNLLAKAGINPDKIVTQSLESDYSYDTNGNYYDGIRMAFRNISDERASEIEAGIANKTLYTKFAQKEFKPDRTLTAYTIELKNYLQKYTDKTIFVEGHTDSIGVNNYKWGLDRANHVKNYLISQGIGTNKIKTSSKGETEPVADNGTEEGRAKNRRIEITVKK